MNEVEMFILLGFEEYDILKAIKEEKEKDYE